MDWKSEECYQLYQRSLRLDYDRSEVTIETYQSHWREFTGLLPAAATIDQVPEYVAKFREQLRARRLKGTTVYAKLSAVHSYFRWLVDEGHIKTDPLVRLKMPPREMSQRSIPTPEILKVVLPRLRSLPRRDRIVIALGVYAGLRVSEMRNLNVESIDFKRMEIHVLNGKGRKDRDVTMHPELASILRPEVDTGARSVQCPHCGYGDGSPLLPGLARSRGNLQRMSKNLPWKAVKEHFPEFSPHDLRALFITVMLEQGVPLEEVQEQVGHSSADTTVRYKGRRNEYAKAKLRRVDFTAKPPAPEDNERIVSIAKYRPNGGRR